MGLLYLYCHSIYYYLTILYVYDCRKVTLTASVILYFAIAAQTSDLLGRVGLAIISIESEDQFLLFVGY